jgi:hypothetical protein
MKELYLYVETAHTYIRWFEIYVSEKHGREIKWIGPMNTTKLCVN